MLSVLGPGEVCHERVTLRHRLEPLTAFSEKRLADLREEWRGEHPWDTHLPLDSSDPEDAHHLTVEEDSTVKVADPVGLRKGLFGSHPSQVPDLILILLPHGDAEFSDVLEVGFTNDDVRRPGYA